MAEGESGGRRGGGGGGGGVGRAIFSKHHKKVV